MGKSDGNPTNKYINKVFIVKWKKAVVREGEDPDTVITSIEIARSIGEILAQSENRLIECIERYHVSVILHDDQESVTLVADS